MRGPGVKAWLANLLGTLRVEDATVLSPIVDKSLLFGEEMLGIWGRGYGGGGAARLVG
jgi:hypothetical protein